MPRPTVVYGYTLGYWRVVVATQTKKAAREAMGISPYEFETYAGETHNDGDMAVAMAHPGLALCQPIDARNGKWWIEHTPGEHVYRPWDKRPADITVEP